MKKIYILTLLICLTCFGTSFAQTLKGHIYDAKTNEPLVGAACYLQAPRQSGSSIQY